MNQVYVDKMKYLKQSTYKEKTFLLTHASVAYNLRINIPSYSGIGSTFINQSTCCGVSHQSPEMIWSHLFLLCEGKEFCFSL